MVDLKLRLLIILLFAIMMEALPVRATEEISVKEEILEIEDNPCSEGDILDSHWFDRTQDYLSKGVCGVASWFDSFFGGEREEEENINRFVRVTNSLTWQQDNGFDFKTRVRARIQLPRFKERFNLIISGEEDRTISETLSQEDEFKEKDPNIKTTKTSSADSGKHSLGIRWNIIREPTSSFSISGRLRLSSLEVKPAIIGRYRYTYGLGPNALSRTTQTLYWYRKDGFGETTRLDLERLITPETLLRWSVVGTYSQLSDGIDWGLETSLFHEFSPKKAISFDIAVWGSTLPSIATENYRIGVRYRRNFYRSWLFFEIEPELSWPKVEDSDKREVTPAIMFRLEFLFGHKREEV